MARTGSTEEFIGAFRRLSGAPGWFVTVGEPISDYYRAMWRPLVALVVGGLVTVGLALLVAFAIGRRIMRPVRALTRQAQAVIASGGTAAVETSPPARVAEFERLRQAVDMAEGTLRTRAAEVALVESRLRMAQEAAGVGVFEADLTAGRTYWSAEMFRLYGMDPAADAPEMRSRHLALVHPADREGLRVARAARIADPAAADFTFEFRIMRADTGEVRWITSRGEFVRGPDGIAVAARGAQQDTTARKAAEARQEFLMREVNHRAKNALAVVQSVVRLTRAEEPAAYAQAVEGRISALARAHTLLAEQGWASTDLKALVDVELAPYGSNSVSCVGPAVPIAHTAAQPIGMVLHELATNAAKHGALNRPEGKVKLRVVVWKMTDSDCDGRRPEDSPLPGRQGGAGLAHALSRLRYGRNLGGSVEKRWEPGGLICTIVVPLARAVATEALPAMASLAAQTRGAVQRVHGTAERAAR